MARNIVCQKARGPNLDIDMSVDAKLKAQSNFFTLICDRGFWLKYVMTNIVAQTLLLTHYVWAQHMYGSNTCGSYIS